MQLGDNVTLVEGSRRVALYDLGRRTLIRAPLFVRGVVSERNSGSTSFGSAEARVVEQLTNAGYLQRAPSHGWQAYSLERHIPSVSPASTLIVAASKRIPKHVSDALEADAETRLVRHLIFVSQAEASAALVRSAATLAARNGFSFEIALETDGRLQSSIYSSRGRLVGRREATDAVNAASLLHIHYGTMVLLRHYVECAGTLFVDGDGVVRPHLSERHFVLGDLTKQSLECIIDGAEYRRHVLNHKGVRQKCGQCELRLGCLRSFVDRADAHDIASAPVSCRYDPTGASYQNDLFT